MGLFYTFFALFIFFFAFAFFAPNNFRQSSACGFFQNGICFVKSIFYHFIFTGQIFHHINILGTLAREHKAYFRLFAMVIKRINTPYFKVQRLLFPNFARGSRLNKKFYFFFKFFSGFRINAYRKLFMVCRMVFIGRLYQIKRVIFYAEKFFTEFFK